jgi:C-terminal processing protease CtpA/Prc
MKKISLLLLLSLILLGSCKKDDILPSDTEITPEQARDTLYYIMKAYYYWFDKMPVVERENYSNPYELLEAMRYRELDRFSAVMDYDDYMAEFNLGEFVGHGIRVGLSDDNKARIALIYKNAPLYAEGVRRGWIIKRINSYDLATILLNNDSEGYTAAFGPGTAGITNIFIFEKPDGSEVTIASTKSSFSVNSVILYDTLHIGSKITGHLVFESFIAPSEQELRTAFSFFKKNNIQDLILDLRYNGGGYLDIAQQLASYIGGNGLAGTPFTTLTYNRKRQSDNITYPFLSTSYSLSLPRIVVISTRLTASASEMIMNCLAPHINVVSVGDTTDGKPVGMNGFDCGRKYFFWPITFKVANSEGEGEYFDGLSPDKIATDDISHDFNNREEECLKEAIMYLKTGSFSTKGNENFRRTANFSEKPDWTNNIFIR